MPWGMRGGCLRSRTGRKEEEEEREQQIEAQTNPTVINAANIVKSGISNLNRRLRLHLMQRHPSHFYHVGGELYLFLCFFLKETSVKKEIQLELQFNIQLIDPQALSTRIIFSDSVYTQYPQRHMYSALSASASTEENRGLLSPGAGSDPI